MPDDNVDKLTPVFAQYKSIKKNFPDALLFFRMGDFYELFFEDAVVASRELQLALTARNKSGANPAPMCGVPWHASQTYVAQLIDKGYNVALCEQIGDPKTSKGLVERAVTAVITPGTVLDEANLGAKSHNYLAAIFCGMHSSALAWADVSTGQWSGVEFQKQADLWQWLGKINPRELLLVDGQRLPATFNQTSLRQVHKPAAIFDAKRSAERLLAAQGTRDLASLGLEGKPSLVRACGAILAYLEQINPIASTRLMPFKPLDLSRRMLIDELTERNLELFGRGGKQRDKASLLRVIDDTITPMGGRFLEDALRHPWRDLRVIQIIQEYVNHFLKNDETREKTREILTRVLDMERLVTRVDLSRATLRDFLALRQSFEAIPNLADTVAASPNVPAGLKKLLASMDRLSDCALLLRSALVEEDKGDAVFKKGYNVALDKQIELLEHGEQKLEALLEEERKNSGVPKLKLGYNRVFGYYFEASRSALGDGLPERFIRRQSLAGGERFTTAELKALEEDLSLARERRETLESEAFENLRALIAGHKTRVLQTADIIAQIDYWQSLASVGRRENWVMPEVIDSRELRLKEARHPVVESVVGKANFVANDLKLDSSRRFCLLTGPNMAGKSTILRQTAIICVLAQMGAPVPASEAVIGVVDRLFSRVGASDNLVAGQSTFMVEMMETARILRQAGKRSLVILDEIGRGTSTYDGMALAWAVAEDLAARAQGNLRTLFATHYHELTSLEGKIPGLFNMNVAVGAYENNEILFLHKLLPGPADRSYGVEVARLAGVPYPVVQRARDILKTLEETRGRKALSVLELPGYKAGSPLTPEQKLAARAARDLKKLNPTELTPELALKLVQSWLKLTGEA